MFFQIKIKICPKHKINVYLFKIKKIIIKIYKEMKYNSKMIILKMHNWITMFKT